MIYKAIIELMAKDIGYVSALDSEARLLLLLLLLSRFSRVRLCATPKTEAHRQPGGSPIPGIPQARKLEWVAISFSVP